MTPAIAAAATTKATSSSSSRMDQYFDENEDDFVMRIVHNSCNIPCQHYGGASGNSTMMDLDVWTHCQQPLDFFAYFAHPHRRADDSMELYHLPMGAYALPKACEYCGAVDTADCHPHECRRPHLYFARKKPPFAVVPPVAATAAVEQPQPQRPTSPSASDTSPRSWVIRGLMWH